MLLWDTRARSRLPVQKTPLTGASSGGHTHPIYSIDVVGTQNANNIISCSTDGVICGWAIDMLSQPQEYLELTTPPPSKTEDLSPTCMAFPPSDPTSFLVGTEEGSVYPCHRYDRAGAKAGVDNRIRYRGHTAPVMSLNFHPARGACGSKRPRAHELVGLDRQALENSTYLIGGSDYHISIFEPDRPAP